MRRTAKMWVVLGLMGGIGVCGRGLAAAGEVKLSGTFAYGGDHPIKAVLTPAGANKWTAVWTFDWNRHGLKGEQTWKGTAEGNLLNGPVKGVCKEPTGRRRTFTFSGTSTNGQMDCKWAPGRGGKLTLKVVGYPPKPAPKPKVEKPKPPPPVAEPPKPEPAPRPKPRVQTKEDRARSAWNMVGNYVRNNMLDMAKGKCKTIIKEYPGTKYAKMAAEKLKELSK